MGDEAEFEHSLLKTLIAARARLEFGFRRPRHCCYSCLDFVEAEASFLGSLRRFHARRISLGNAVKVYVTKGGADGDGQIPNQAEWYHRWYGNIHVLCDQEKKTPTSFVSLTSS